MDANVSCSSTTSESENSDGSASSCSSISGDGLITRTKSAKSAVWKYFGYKYEAAMKKETALC